MTTVDGRLASGAISMAQRNSQIRGKGTQMNGFLSEVIEAHGGMERWNAYE